MNMDIIKAVALSKKYTDSVSTGISKIETEGNDIIFTLPNGNKATVTVPIPEGVKISNVSLDDNYNLIVSMSDGTSLDAGNLPIKSLNDEINNLKASNLISNGDDDTSYSIKNIITTSSKLSDLEVKYGQLIFVTDTKELYLDTENRILFNPSFIVFETEVDRLAYPYPINCFYYIKETGILWRYQKGLWIQLTKNIEEQIIFEDFNNFPIVGNSNRLYIDKTNIYRWIDGEYVNITQSLWEQLD